MQRRFQLMRNVRGELAPQLLGLFLFGRIEHQKRGARDPVAGHYGACIQPVAHAAEGYVLFAVLAAERLFYSLAQRRRRAELTDVLTYAVAAYIQSLCRSLVYTQDAALLIEQNKPLGHTARRCVKLVAAAAQLLFLLAKLILLALELVGQRSELGVGIDPLRVVKAHLV